MLRSRSEPSAHSSCDARPTDEPPREPAMIDYTKLGRPTPLGWDTLPFSEAVLVNPSVSLPKGEDAPFVDMASLEPRRSTVSASRLREYRGSGSRFVDGDTLMARITPSLENGKIARFRGDSEAERAHGSTEFIVVRGRDGISDTKYAFYLTRSDLVREYAISQMTGTSGRQRVPPESLGHLEVVLPPLAEQHAIARVLGTLDDRIELNLRMNETLEAMARALFKSWFVDFDPVRAKMAGRDTGLPSHIADLFPDRLVDSEMGDVPEGWTAGTLSDVANLSPESWNRRSAPDVVRYVDLTNVKWGTIDDIRTFAWGDAPSRARRILHAGDTIVGTVRPRNGSWALIGHRGLTGSTGFAVLRPRVVTQRELVWCAATSPGAIERLGHLADGGAYPAVRPKAVVDTAVVLPDEPLQVAFSVLVGPMLDALLEGQREIRTLAALRDALLPKLISGAIRVPDVTRFEEMPA